MIAVALALVAYILGSTPTSFLLARYVQGIDLRKWGSGNLGATNLYRAAGLPLAGASVLVDVGKGFLPTWLFPQIDGLAVPELALVYGIAAMIGHIFSIWLRFRGGKGVATGGGIYLALAPAAVGIAALIWTLVVFSTRIVSIGSLLAAAVLPVLVWLTRGQIDYVFWSTLPVLLFVWWNHRANIGRLLAGKELPARRGVGAPEASSVGSPSSGSEGKG